MQDLLPGTQSQSSGELPLYQSMAREPSIFLPNNFFIQKHISIDPFYKKISFENCVLGENSWTNLINEISSPTRTRFKQVDVTILKGGTLK